MENRKDVIFRFNDLILSLRIEGKISEYEKDRIMYFIKEELNRGTYFKKIDGRFNCLRCSYSGTSFMGIMSHIRKHKNEDEKNIKQVKL